MAFIRSLALAALAAVFVGEGAGAAPPPPSPPVQVPYSNISAVPGVTCNVGTVFANPSAPSMPAPLSASCSVNGGAPVQVNSGTGCPPQGGLVYDITGTVGNAPGGAPTASCHPGTPAKVVPVTFGVTQIVGATCANGTVAVNPTTGAAAAPLAANCTLPGAKPAWVTLSTGPCPATTAALAYDLVLGPNGAAGTACRLASAAPVAVPKQVTVAFGVSQLLDATCNAGTVTIGVTGVPAGALTASCLLPGAKAAAPVSATGLCPTGTAPLAFDLVTTPNGGVASQCRPASAAPVAVPKKVTVAFGVTSLLDATCDAGTVIIGVDGKQTGALTASCLLPGAKAAAPVAATGLCPPPGTAALAFDLVTTSNGPASQCRLASAAPAKGMVIPVSWSGIRPANNPFITCKAGTIVSTGVVETQTLNYSCSSIGHEVIGLPILCPAPTANLKFDINAFSTGQVSGVCHS